MNQINFLPPSFQLARQDRRRTVWRAVCIAAVLVCYLGVSVGLSTHVDRQRRMADRMESTVKSETGVMGLINRLEKQRHELLRQVELNRELNPPVTYAQVLAQVGELLPEGVSIRELVLNSLRPDPEPLPDPKAEGARKVKAVKADSPPARPPHLLGVELEGLAPDDLAVANFIASLDRVPLFGQVTLRSTAAVETQGVRARRFRLTTTIDLDRIVLWNVPSQEVAHVDQ